MITGEIKRQNRPVARLGSRIAARFRKAGLTSDLPELRGQLPRSADSESAGARPLGDPARGTLTLTAPACSSDTFAESIRSRS